MSDDMTYPESPDLLLFFLIRSGQVVNKLELELFVNRSPQKGVATNTFCTTLLALLKSGIRFLSQPTVRATNNVLRDMLRHT